MGDPIATELRRLSGLGTADAIAADLFDRGIRGLVIDCHHCPLARRLAEISGDAEVGMMTVEALGREYRLPRPVRRFVLRFDAGHYPELCASKTLALELVRDKGGRR